VTATTNGALIKILEYSWTDEWSDSWGTLSMRPPYCSANNPTHSHLECTHTRTCAVLSKVGATMTHTATSSDFSVRDRYMSTAYCELGNSQVFGNVGSLLLSHCTSSALHASCDYSMTSKPLQLALLFIVPNRTFWSYSDSRHLVLCPSVSKKYQVNKFHEVIVNHFPIFISLL
jgi:hypothetical protein